MRTLMLKRFEGHVRRSAFVVGIVLDEEENKMEIMLDPVRAPHALTHTLKILFILQKHGGDGGACAGVGVGHTEVEAAGTAVWLFHAGELSAVLMGMRRVVISALRG